MNVNGLIGLVSIGLCVLGQVEPGITGLASNMTGIGLAVFMVMRFGTAIDRLTEAITSLRVHCAVVNGVPKEKTPAASS